jgi:hypothetical protein
MHTTIQLATLLLAISPAVLAKYDPSAPVHPSASVTTTLPANAPLGTAYKGALDLDYNDLPAQAAPTAAPAPTNGVHINDVNVDVPSVTVNYVNSMTVPVNYIHVSDPASPPFVGAPGPSSIPPAATIAVVMPQDFSGQTRFGLSDPVDSQGTKAEMSLSRDPNTGEHNPFLDISYVDGYSVPMTCSCNSEVVAGCNIELWNTGITCPAMGTGPTCYNPHAHEGFEFTGPADPFFAPCQGAAYTFPSDNLGTMGCPGATTIDCCIGTACPAPARQAPPPAKRSILKRAVRGDAV